MVRVTFIIRFGLTEKEFSSVYFVKSEKYCYTVNIYALEVTVNKISVDNCYPNCMVTSFSSFFPVWKYNFGYF